MIVAVVSFQLPKATTPEDMSSPFNAAVPPCQKVPGLLQKYFYVSDDGRRAGGIYMWASRADADRLYGGEWRVMVEAKFGGPPTIDFLDSPVMIDNRDGTVTAPQTPGSVYQARRCDRTGQLVSQDHGR